MRPRVVPYPFLLAIWPPVALAARNAEVLDGWSELLAPCLLGAGAAGAGWLLAALLRLPPHARPIVAAAAGLLVWGYRLLMNGVGSATLLHQVGLGPYAGLIVMVGVVLIVVLVGRRLPPALARATPALNLMAALLLGVAITGFWRGRAPAPSPVDRSGASVIRPQGREEDPDVFLIVLDAYTGAASLQANYGFDNTPFLDRLRNAGFVVPDRFRANYPQTALALASFLYRDYLDGFAPGLPREANDWKALVQRVSGNPTWRGFWERGYQLAYLPYAEWATGPNPLADFRFRFQSSEYRVAWRAMTPLPELETWYRRVRGRGVAQATADRNANQLDAQFESLGRLERNGRPLAVFAHLLVPHDPYVYQADCTHRTPPLWPAIDRTITVEDARNAYLDQLRCVNEKVLALIEARLERAGPPPVIVLMSDHGRGEPPHDLPTLGEASASLVQERMDAFAAILVPAPLRDGLARADSPVALSRALFAGLWGLPLAPLPHRAFWSPSALPFALESLPAESDRPTGLRPPS